MKNKTIIAGVAATVTLLLLGWIVYGMLLRDFLPENLNKSIFRAEADLKWWALIISNLFWGFMLAILLSWANTSGFASGMQRGLLIGFLVAASYDLGLHFMVVYYITRNGLIVDIVVATILSGIAGGVIGMIIDPARSKPLTA